MKKLLILAMIVLTATTHAMAAEKMAIKDIDTDALTTETQVTPPGAGDEHLALVWWIPNEFWESILSRDTTTVERDKKAMLDSMSGISLLAVVQADISSLGAFMFYSMGDIEKNMMVSFVGADGKKHKVSQVQKVNPDLEVVLGVFKPILGAAMGNLGNNMHFYVLDDKSKTSKRLLDPYEKGLLNIHLTKKDNVRIQAEIEMPLNSLFVPRKCPNGKDAHVSWNYCPWSGKQLAD